MPGLPPGRFEIAREHAGPAGYLAGVLLVRRFWRFWLPPWVFAAGNQMDKRKQQHRCELPVHEQPKLPKLIQRENRVGVALAHRRAGARSAHPFPPARLRLIALLFGALAAVTV